jgi:AraC family transcriptional regulator of adaptative response/methylated-DNA-[protein]-cysteine methyltransferase
MNAQAQLYGVKTTGIYCRMSCPSRRARPENVVYFDNAQQARAAGFRACRRCKPDGVSSLEEQTALIAKACRLLERAGGAPDLATLAKALRRSPGYLHRSFKRATGVTPAEYARAHRAGRAREALRATPRITDAIYAAGYGSSGRFYAKSMARLGMTPGKFRAGGAQEEIRFALGECSLGSFLVASSAKGVVAITLGEDPQTLLRELQDSFPLAMLRGADADFEKLIAQLVGLIDRPHEPNKLPLDVRGTAFQQRVWKALTRIPAGSTRTYAQIARQIGAPRAVRAVASACAANGLAVVIPCHRVVRTDGSVSGYRWGVERKSALLARERDPSTEGPTQR